MTRVTLARMRKPSDAFYYEARRICDKRGFTDAEDHERIAASLRHRAFMDAVQPYLDMKGRIAALAMPKLMLYPDGMLKVVDDGMTEDMRNTLWKIDELIEQVRHQIMEGSLA